MPYISEEGGRLNNFAAEPKMYTAEPPDNKQKKSYLILGVVATALVGGLLAVAASVS
ncbi:ssl1498 family light-harvesting-like protein [Oculatella sp. LEGE 06141]|uniref:photosystem II assembly protein Psb34 n=1 Tax=Oculatella sp. LEGE 06141 TaxID=1828648 RepID=UPI00187E2502|nr:ssl1498 family light-harvesting-like protein [Oculatella sp. LEGE 06141]MBE9181104.1 ssl1498 family light-harvesting-like protein [Oculatella sp. LEGE 06141]